MANTVAIGVVCLTLTFGLLGVVGWALWDDWDRTQDRKDKEPSEVSQGVYKTPIAEGITLITSLIGQQLFLQVGNVTGFLGGNVPFAGIQGCGNSCGQYPDGTRINIRRSQQTAEMTCATVEWTGRLAESGQDCYNISSARWFGGFEEYHQAWPMSGARIKESAFVTGDAWESGQYGGVIEPLFVSSAGVGIYVDDSTPLYLSVNEKSNLICLKGVAGKGSAFTNDPSKAGLQYDICKARDVTTLWKAMAKKYLEKPTASISPQVLRKPIWSTWAKYKSGVNQSKVQDFAHQIVKHDLPVSQLEIDDNWTPEYGDLTFDTKKFPDAVEMIKDLSQEDIPVTVWVHPFFNNESESFREFANISGLVTNANTGNPALVSWWRGTKNAGMLDVTSQAARQLFLEKLQNLKDKYNVTSFKFDAGETHYLPENYKFNQTLSNPSLYTKNYVDMALEADPDSPRLEVRAAYHNQRNGVMVRMLDRASDWSKNRGIQTVIPTVLTFGLMGYPFVLPDIIGGNAMNQTNLSDMDAVVLPDVELYIRWLQLSTFLPVMQMSVAPWDYKNQTVMDVTKKFLELHQNYSHEIERLGQEATTTGYPIIRPVWWNDPQDEAALAVDSEFLLGDDLLVAPVLEEGQRSRDIYLPSGLWFDELRKTPVRGGWLKNYRVELDELPYFSRVKPSR